MAKKKTKKAIEAEVAIEENIIEEVNEEDVTVEVTEDVESEVVTPAVVEEEVIEVVEPKVDDKKSSDQFIYTQLKAINKMNNPAKARRLAARVLRNKK